MRVRSVLSGGLAAVALVALVGGSTTPTGAETAGPSSGSAATSSTAPSPAPRAGATWRPGSPTPVPVDPAGPESVGVDEGAGNTAGFLDGSFDDDGIFVRRRSNSGPMDAAAVVVQADGRIVVGGGKGYDRSDFQLIRLEADGSVDPSFGDQGYVVTNHTSSGADWVEDLALDADGRILAVGTAGGRMVAVRYTPSGALDRTFGDQGRVIFRVGGSFNVATSVAVDGSGRVLLAGRGGGHGGRVVVARLDPTGAFDPSFGDQGVVVADLTPGDDFASDLVVLPDDRVAVAATTGGAVPTMAVLQFKLHGRRDRTFDGDGRRDVTFGRRGAVATSLALQPDGRLVVGGLSFGKGGQMLLARLDPAGRLDPTFSGDGLAPVDFGAGLDYAWRLAIQPDGAIVAAGRAGGAGGRVGVARVLANGAPDPSFDFDGRLTTNVTPGEDQAHSIALDGEGRIVVSGVADGAATDAGVLVIRYLGA